MSAIWTRVEDRLAFIRTPGLERGVGHAFVATFHANSVNGGSHGPFLLLNGTFQSCFAIVVHLTERVRVSSVESTNLSETF